MVTFDPCGGYFPEYGAASYEIKISYEIGKPYGQLPRVNPPNPVSVFDGWYTESTGGYKVDATTQVIPNQKLYARFK